MCDPFFLEKEKQKIKRVNSRPYHGFYICYLTYMYAVDTTSRPGVVPRLGLQNRPGIKDFNREELPLLIFANWRGFSGGMKGRNPSPLLRA